MTDKLVLRDVVAMWLLCAGGHCRGERPLGSSKGVDRVVVFVVEIGCPLPMYVFNGMKITVVKVKGYCSRAGY